MDGLLRNPIALCKSEALANELRAKTNKQTDGRAIRRRRRAKLVSSCMTRTDQSFAAAAVALQ